MGSTTRLRLRSRATRLAEGTRRPPVRPDLTGLSPSTADRSRSPVRDGGPDDVRSERYNSGPPNGDPDFGTSSALFIRHYWGHPGWFLFLRLLICLNSAGDRARVEVEKKGEGGGRGRSFALAGGGEVASDRAVLRGDRRVPLLRRPAVAVVLSKEATIGGRDEGSRPRRADATGSRGARAEPFGGRPSRRFVRDARPNAPRRTNVGARFAFKVSRIRAGHGSSELSRFVAFFLEGLAKVSVVKSRASPSIETGFFLRTTGGRRLFSRVSFR